MGANIQGQPRLDDSLQKVNKHKFISEDTSLGVNDQVVVADSSSNTITITLPPVALAAGRTYFIHAESGNTNAVTVTDKGSDSRNFEGDYTLNSANDRMALKSDGMKWWAVVGTL